MGPITTAERAKYAEVWGALESYGDKSLGVTYLPIFTDIVGPAKRRTVLDAGTGSGKAAVGLQTAGFRVTACDLTDEGLVEEAKGIPFVQGCLWQPLRPLLPTGHVDLVYCTDVLEHIPEALTMLAVSQLLAVARQGVFLGVSTMKDASGVWVGRTLHETVRSFPWWKSMLQELGVVEDARDLLMAATFYLTRRR